MYSTEYVWPPRCCAAADSKSQRDAHHPAPRCAAPLAPVCRRPYLEVQLNTALPLPNTPPIQPIDGHHIYRGRRAGTRSSRGAAHLSAGERSAEVTSKFKWPLTRPEQLMRSVYLSFVLGHPRTGSVIMDKKVGQLLLEHMILLEPFGPVGSFDGHDKFLSQGEDRMVHRQRLAKVYRRGVDIGVERVVQLVVVGREENALSRCKHA
mmetsp:Transcript_31549/g.77750  ORF Transcript_31549/g.77750 Transcript_31549/m.77750 type:complete len:207 (-) Transcript_31549:602-1222(-)